MSSSHSRWAAGRRGDAAGRVTCACCDCGCPCWCERMAECCPLGLAQKGTVVVAELQRALDVILFLSNK